MCSPWVLLSQIIFCPVPPTWLNLGGQGQTKQHKKRVADTQKRDKRQREGSQSAYLPRHRCTRMAILGSSSNARSLLSSGSSLSHPLLCARACRGEFLPFSCRQLQQSHKLLGLNWGSDNRRQQVEERGALMTSDRQQFSSTSIRRRRYCSFLAPCCCSSAPTEASVSNGKHQTPPPNGSSAEFPYNCWFFL